MLEGLAALVLNSYIGEYFGNVNTDQVSIALHQGHVELEGLPLKKNAFKHLGLPVDIKAGWIGRISLKIPVYRMRSEAWSIVIEDLFLVARPMTDFSYNEEEEEQIFQDHKLGLLDSMEAGRKAQLEARVDQSYYASSYSSWLSFGTSMITNIMENLQLKVNNVHLRYEDDSSITGQNFACGLLIESLSAQSTDETWTPKYVSRDFSHVMRKLMQLNQLSIYWDRNVELVGDLPLPDMIVAMKQYISNQSQCTNSDSHSPSHPLGAQHDYIVSPICGRALLKRNCSEKPLRSRSEPRISIDVEVEQLNVVLSEQQYRQMLEWSDEFSRSNTRWKYRKYRPIVPIKGNAVLWWKFASECYLESYKRKRDRQNWEFVIKRAKDLRNYSFVYFVHLVRPETLSKDMKEIKDRIETELTFDELVILRDIVFDKISRNQTKVAATTTTSRSQSSSWLYWWWSSAAAQSEDPNQEKALKELEILTSESEPPPIDEPYPQCDDSEPGSDSFIRRDAVFIHSTFSINQSTFSLLSTRFLHHHQELNSPISPSSPLKPFIELEFSALNVEVETRPKSRSYMFKTKLGGLYVKDKYSRNPTFPCLVSPQQSKNLIRQQAVDALFHSSKTRHASGTTFSSGIASPAEPASPLPPVDSNSETPLFQLSYEKKPIDSITSTDIAASNTLSICSKPLEVVYNHEAFQALKNFFVVNREPTVIQVALAEAAKLKYEELKEQTKAGLQQAWEKMMEAAKNSKPMEDITSSTWDIDLDISAPQIIVPVDLFDLNSTLVIFDFGRFKFRNRDKLKNEDQVEPSPPEEPEEEESEIFATPSSSPPQSLMNKSRSRTSISQAAPQRESYDPNEMIENMVRSKFYEHYVVEITEIQVLVGRAKDNWMFGLIKGSGPMHLLNRLSLSLHFQRKLDIAAADRSLPCAKIRGNLPKLAAYLNEEKLNAVLKCLQNLMSEALPIYPEAENPLSGYSFGNQSNASLNSNSSQNFFPTSRKSSNTEPINLLECEFSLDEISIALQSRGENLVELQMSKIDAFFKRRPPQTSMSLCIQSLLLIDAHQKYGPEFDVLLASHENVGMDTATGHVQDHPDLHHFHMPHQGSAFHFNSKNFYRKDSFIRRSGALIAIEYVFNEAKKSQSLEMHFDTLDFIANQETIIELVAFFKRIMPSAPPTTLDPDTSFSSQSTDLNRTAIDTSQDMRYTYKFLFRHLNVLLLGTRHDQRRIATATVTGANVIAKVASDQIFIGGSLGELKVFDLTGDGEHHETVINIEVDQMPEETSKPISNAASVPFTFPFAESDKTSSIYHRSLSQVCETNSEKAISFYIRRLVAQNVLEINCRMASLYYIHSAKLLVELQSCAAEFKAYMSVVAEKIKTKAADVAKEMVYKSNLSFSLQDLQPAGTPFSDKGEIAASVSAHESQSEPASPSSSWSFIEELKVNVHIQSPVLVIPWNDKTSHTLIAHLGHISIQNQSSASASLSSPDLQLFASTVSSANERRKDRMILLEAKDMSLYCVDSNSMSFLTADSKFHSNIHDWKDADVPLLQATVSCLQIHQSLNAKTFDGFARLSLSCNYFNKSLSGWEPFVEPWNFTLEWTLIKAKIDASNNRRRLTFNINAQETLNINITSTLLDIYRIMRDSWFTESSPSSSPITSPQNHSTLGPQGLDKTIKKGPSRAPFIPFALKNETGCRFYFTLVTSQSSELSFRKISSVQLKDRKLWQQVDPGEIKPFSFDVANDQAAYQKDLDHLKIRKIIVQVEGWKPMLPVSVDRVGQFFRDAETDDVRFEASRVVFSVRLDGNTGRKLINVRSAIQLSNFTPNPVEIQFEHSRESLYIDRSQTKPIPLMLVRDKMRARPCDVGVSVCSQPIQWEHLRRAQESSCELLTCPPLSVTNSHSKSYATALPYRFCAIVERGHFPPDSSSQGPGLRSYKAQAGHHITLLPPLQIHNLLPCELKYRVHEASAKGSINPGESTSVPYVDTSQLVKLEFSLDNFPKCRPLILNPGSTRDFSVNIELYDRKDRKLVLTASVNVAFGGPALQLNISAPYWFVNKTGLPLIFKQDNTDREAAGQFEEHEMARSIIPLMFSFTEPDAGMTCIMRLGRRLGDTRWCKSFYLEKGSRVRRLRIAPSDHRQPDRVYEIGIDVRRGRGRFRETQIVTLSPKYHIENSSTYRLELTQRFAVENESELRDNVISVLTNSSVAFHWPRADQDKLICVRVSTIPGCHWSGGFAVESNMSFHLNVRDDLGRCHFLRVQILLQNATFFIVFTDANNLPPPIRIDNFTEVPIDFRQTRTTKAWMRSRVKPKSSFAYAWDEPTLNPYITACAPGNCCSTYDMNCLASGDNLTYENFIYIAFTCTFVDADEDQVIVRPFIEGDISTYNLVLDVPEGSQCVILNRKEPGKRSQLWRLDSSGRLLHEGSSPPHDPRKPFKVDSSTMVLDVATQCAIPGEFTPLMLRKFSQKRSLTQLWHFTEEGRLTCEQPDLFVQPKGGFEGLKEGVEACLGPLNQNAKSFIFDGIPKEEAICTQKMRKGSGVLGVSVVADGPTRVLRIVDANQKESPRHYVSHMWPSTSKKTLELQLLDASSLNWQFYVNILGGIGFSIINHRHEELMYILLKSIIIDYSYNTTEHILNCSVHDFQVDNQMNDAERPVVLYVTEQPPNDYSHHLPAIHLSAHKLLVPDVDAHVFKHFHIKVKDMTFNLEEILMLKSFEFLGWYLDEDPSIEEEKEEQAANRAVISVLNQSAKCYFSILKIDLAKVNLSVFSTAHLSEELQSLKRKSGFKLVRFEEAMVQLAPFIRQYRLETIRFLTESCVEHYRLELKRQAAKILGAVDFLGNPLGFMNDVSDGINELIHEGNVGGLVLNVAHGMADSTAKFTSVLSDSLGIITMDPRHQQIRQRIRMSNSHHMSAGLKGLGVGVFGGVTSLITQTYQGAATEGLPGFFTGLGKGLLGTITKPAVGVLDLSTSMARYVRDTSRKISKNELLIDRTRPPRQCNGLPHRLITPYDYVQATGQLFFYTSPVVQKEDHEMFYSFDLLSVDVAVIISSEKVRFLKWNEKNLDFPGSTADRGKNLLTIEFDRLSRCITSKEFNSAAGSGYRYFLIPILMHDTPTFSSFTGSDLFPSFGSTNQNPKIRCMSEADAKRTADQINFAKSEYEERKHEIPFEFCALHNA